MHSTFPSLILDNRTISCSFDWFATERSRFGYVVSTNRQLFTPIHPVSLATKNVIDSFVHQFSLSHGRRASQQCIYFSLMDFPVLSKKWASSLCSNPDKRLIFQQIKRNHLFYQFAVCATQSFVAIYFVKVWRLIRVPVFNISRWNYHFNVCLVDQFEIKPFEQRKQLDEVKSIQERKKKL